MTDIIQTVYDILGFPAVTPVFSRSCGPYHTLREAIDAGKLDPVSIEAGHFFVVRVGTGYGYCSERTDMPVLATFVRMDGWTMVYGGER